MQKILAEADSYRRENPEDKITKDKYTEDKSIKDKHTQGKEAVEKNAADQSISEENAESYCPAMHVRNANSRTIFRNHKLTCQFLRDYTGLSIFSDLQPEDIEDVTDRYEAFLGVEFETDTIKKVRIRIPDGEREVFVLPLIEHKTDVDYDVAMQLFRYMAVIWYDYKKQQESLKEGCSSLKGFRYPAIVPIVYYEGRAEWSAGLRLSDRINLSGEIQRYIPDFTYKVIRVHGYRNEELKKKHDEMSLVMMINRIQTPEDYTEFLNLSKEYADEIYNGTTSDIKALYKDILWSLFQKMNVPVEEAREKLAKMEESGMGYLFANMEEMDIQAERRNTKAAREEAEAAKLELREANQELEETSKELKVSNQKLEISNQRLAETSGKLNFVLGQLVSICRGESLSREETIVCLRKRYGLDAQDAVSAVEHFWTHS